MPLRLGKHTRIPWWMVIAILPLAATCTVAISWAFALWQPLGQSKEWQSRAFWSPDQSRAWRVRNYSVVFGHTRLETEPLVEPKAAGDALSFLMDDCEPTPYRASCSIMTAPGGRWELPDLNLPDGIIEHHFGWPFRSARARITNYFLSADIIAVSQTYRRVSQAAMPDAQRTMILSAFEDGAEPAVPMAFLWPGFIGNTLIWASLLFALAAGACRWIAGYRQRRGVCGNCKYSLTGLGESAVCPECGTPAPISREQRRVASLQT